MTDQQRRQINEAIARAMGWTAITSEVGFPPDDSRTWRDKMKLPLPDFSSDAAASRSLVEWLKTQDDDVQEQFAHKLAAKTEAADSFAACRGAYYGYEVLALLTAPLEIIALAAFQAIGGKLDE